MADVGGILDFLIFDFLIRMGVGKLSPFFTNILPDKDIENSIFKKKETRLPTVCGVLQPVACCLPLIATLPYLRGMEKEVVLSGIRPTGFLHLGNYFGAMRNYVRMQDEFNCYFFVANWHSLTTHPDTKELKNSVHRVIAENVACGLDPDKVALYVQSDVPEIAELYLYLNMMAYKGELEKTVTFKEKVRLQPDNVNAGLLTYPVLQAADILIHRAVKVPVGKTRSNTLKWPAIMQNDLTIVMAMYCHYPMHLIMAENW